MVADSKRVLRNGKRYDNIIPRAKGQDILLQSGTATVFDTVNTIKDVVSNTLEQTSALAEVLKSGPNVRQTCQNIWDWIYQHIQYKIDVIGTEQVREPARSWADRTTGVDCDCYSTLISSILTNLQIPHVLRMTAYKKSYQHIYVIVPKNQVRYERCKLDKNNYYVIDCVKDAFDAEHGPITAFKDFPMDLAQLNGFDYNDDGLSGVDDFAYEVDGLGRVKINRRRRSKKQTVAQVKLGADGKPTTVPIQNAPIVVVPSASKSNENGFNQRADQAKPGKTLMPLRTASMTRTNKLTVNTGQLKNGTNVTLGVIVPERWLNNIFAGSSKGYTFYDRILMYNGVPTAHSLMRFNIIDGVLRGHDTRGIVYVDFGGGGGLQRVAGNKNYNPGSALGGLGALADLQDSGSGPMISIDQYGNVLSGLGNISQYGLMIDAEYFFKALARRKNKLGLSGLDNLEGFGALNAVLGPMLDEPAFVDMVDGLGEFDGDDINGLIGTDGVAAYVGEITDISLSDGSSMLEGTGDDYILTMDGLGRVKRGRVNRASGRKRSGRPASATAPAMPAVTELIPPAAKGKRLGFYIPLNTLRSLMTVRRAQIERLNSNGHTFATNDASLNGLGSFFQDLGKNISRTFSSQNLLSQAAKLSSFIPGAGAFIQPLVSQIVDGQIAKDNDRGGAGQQSSQIVPLALLQDMTNDQEVVSAYNADATKGLEGIFDDAGNWIKNNPGWAFGMAVAGGYLGYKMLTGKTSGVASLGGTKRKKRHSHAIGKTQDVKFTF